MCGVASNCLQEGAVLPPGAVMPQVTIHMYIHRYVRTSMRACARGARAYTCVRTTRVRACKGAHVRAISACA